MGGRCIDKEVGYGVSLDALKNGFEVNESVIVLVSSKVAYRGSNTICFGISS
jgi:hypothetical protein